MINRGYFARSYPFVCLGRAIPFNGIPPVFLPTKNVQ